ncbi:MAG TPA: hypothetical protein VF201_05695 [Nitrolancea sp.]
MSLGDIGFVAAFIALPLVIVALCILGSRTLSQRQHQPLARFSSNTPAESTQELPVAQVVEAERNWAAKVQPTRGQAAKETPASERTQTFVMPNYRGRGRGVVRRVNTKPKRSKQRPE